MSRSRQATATTKRRSAIADIPGADPRPAADAPGADLRPVADAPGALVGESVVRPDPFGTEGIRERVLAAWAAAPARFREDANAEEDYALGGYRDRVIVELAQNAADAALRAGVPGRLRLTLADGTLTAANTGHPLDREGVESLSTLRASAKRQAPGEVGRFGVGFAAVVAVSDAPEIGSHGGGVGWSVARTRRLVAGIAELAGELRAREGAVPALRLPFALDDPPVLEGFDTVVRLPLRDSDAVESVRRQLDQVGPALMLALPALHTVEISIEGEADRTLTAEWADGTMIIDGVPWRAVEETGALDPALLADRPTEERYRPYWRVRWAVPEGIKDDPFAGGERGLPPGVPQVLHAPTPSDEPLGLPALLLASFPLAPDRRHVAPGPLTDFLVEQAAAGYVELMRRLGIGPRLLDLVPGPMAAGALDASLRRAILDRLKDSPLRDAVVVDGPAALLEPLSEVLPGLLPPEWPARHPALAALGIRRMELADVVDALAGLDREPEWWHRLYAAFAGADTDGLGALPVPLADGRTVRGPRGLLLAAAEIDPADLGVLGLRFVHPDAAHPLLLRLGAVAADARAVLADPAVRAAVEESFAAEQADEAEEIAEAVLSLVAAARLRPGDEPWLAELALPAEDGELYPAGELLLPDAPLGSVLADDSPFGVVDAELVERFGAEALQAVGVLGTFGVVTADEVSLADVVGGLFHLDEEEAWADDVMARLPDQDIPPLLAEFTAVRDLELVEDWAGAMELLSRPPLRAALTEPAHLLLPDGRRVAVPSYTAWWLSGHPVLAGRTPGELRTAGADPLLAELYDPAPSTADPELARALGVRSGLDELLAEPGGADELLDRLADPARTVSRATLRGLWIALAEADLAEPTPPDHVRAVVDGVVEVVPAGDALVLDRPDVLPLLAGQPLVIAPYPLADRIAALLDLAHASEEVAGEIESDGVERATPQVLLELLPEAPESYREHETLVVDGQAVPWWWDDRSGVVHAAGDAGLARAMAWAAGRWPDRALAEAVLRDPGALASLLAEADLD